ncbi:MAG TPA: serine/threonine-protein kinase [Polyangiales bacterium]|nr:serine/threonine-protein kinase [Polyangiales bacterium]
MMAPSELINQLVLGRYRIVSQLAHGGMGAVYLGRTEGAEGFARPVVIKRVLPGLSDKPDIARMFVREAQILSNLQHPNIVPILDFGRHTDATYMMVLEYFHGYPLSAWFQYLRHKQRQFSLDFALYIVLRVLDALHYAHNFKSADGKFLGMVHRDVTPTNILLDEHGTVKLLDFGIARASGEQAVVLTERSRVKGKLPYMPPEALDGAEPDIRMDVYSIAVVLYELLSGSHPFVAADATATLARALEFVPPPLHVLRRDLPPALDVALARGMHKQRDQRFANAGHFARALRAVCQTTDDAVVAELAAQLKTDFHGSMPPQLGLQRLETRELAWRTALPMLHAPDPPRPDASDTQVDLTAPIPLLDQTVETDVSESMRAKSRRSERAPAARGGAGSLSRSVMIAAVAAVIGAGAALAAFLGVSSSNEQDRLVVISRESSAGQLPVALAQEPAPQPADAPAPEPAPAATPARTSVAASARAPSTPLAPDPVALTRTFSRRSAQVTRCFNEHAAPEGAEAVSLHFRVTESGEVAEVGLRPVTLDSTALGQCLLELARSTNFGPLTRAVAFQIPLSVHKL